MSSIHLTINALKRDAISDTYLIAERLAKDSSIAMFEMDSEIIKDSVQSLLNFSDIDDIVLYDLYGHPLLGEPPKEIEFDKIAEMEIKTDHASLLNETKDKIFIVSPIFIGTTEKSKRSDSVTEIVGHAKDINHQDLIGYVLISLSKLQLQQMRQEIWVISLFCILTAISVLLFLLVQISNKITISIEHMIRFLSDPDTARYFKKIPITGIKEMRDISTSFNTLMNTLERSNSELIFNNTQLQNQVIKNLQELKQAKDEARQYNQKNCTLISSINSTIEEERKYIARELHDQLNAEILFIKLKLRRLLVVIKKYYSDTEEIEPSIIEMLDRVSNIYGSTRNIIKMLRPEVMDSLGLIGSIEDIIDMIATTKPECKIRLDHKGDFSGLSNTVLMTIFRIIQESLSNAGKYAQATEISIQLYFKCEPYKQGIFLYIVDDGKGFEMKDRCHEGMGLTSIRERVHALNGQLKIITAPDEGTKIMVHIPLYETADDIEERTVNPIHLCQ
jgi:signal transduction histidine kinase